MQNDQNGAVNTGGGNVRFTQLYIHGWQHTGNSNNVGFFSQGGPGSMADHNIIDGSDSTENTFNGFYSQWSQIQYNYIQYVVSGILASTDAVHDNTIQHTVTSADGDHCNALFTFMPATGNTQLIYNNVIDNGDSCPGGVVLWFNGNGSTDSSWIGYGFGNVMYNLSSNPVNIGNHGSGNYGTYYWFNNTVDCTAGGCGGPPPSGPYWTIYDNNNDTIGGALDFTCSGCTVPICSDGTGTGCTDLNQSESVANGQGYTSTETYPYSPASACTSSTCGTLQNGTNVMSYCNALSSTSGVGTSAAATACQSSTSAGCAYNTSNHTLSCPNDGETARPASGAWNIGAYQLASTGCAVTPAGIGPYTVGQLVSQQFTASSCSTSTFTISSGSLLGSGLTLSSGGLLSGTAQAGSLNFTVAYGTANDAISLTINAAPSITTSSLPAGQVNVSYSQLLSSSGGTGAVTCAMTNGSLPAGLTLSGCTISGTPTTANTYGFSVTPTDANGVSGSAQALSILVNSTTQVSSGAVSIVQEYAQGHGTQTGTYAFPPTGTFTNSQAAGDTNVIVFEYCGLPGGAGGGDDCLASGSPGPAISVTDTAGNTYTRVCGPLTTLLSGSYVNECGGGTPTTDGYTVTVEVWASVGIKTASAGNVVTANMPTIANMTGWNVWLFQLHAASGTVVFDRYASLQTGTAAAPRAGPISTGTTPTTSYANEFLFAYCSTANGTCPPSLSTPTWTEFGLNGETYYDTHSDAATQIVTSTGTYSESFTAGSGATEWLGMIVTFGSATAGSPPSAPMTVTAIVH